MALHAPKTVVPVLATKLEEVMVRSTDEVGGAPGFDPGAWDAILAGPGWIPGYQDESTLAQLLETGLPMVIDAGAIALFGRLAARALPTFSPSRPIILTPHPGEFLRLCAESGETPSMGALLADPARYLIPLTEKLGVCIVLKSHVTWIAIPGSNIRIWDGQESGLGTAGSGDVLAGLTAGLLARRTRSMAESEGGSPSLHSRAAEAAVIAHGLAGRIQRKKAGWFAAGDLIPLAARLLDPAATIGAQAEEQTERGKPGTPGEDRLR